MALTGEQLLEQVRELRQWRSGEQRAAHKPLLLLLALGRLRGCGQRLLTYTEVERPLIRLLEQFGPPRDRQRPDYPFWRLRLDGQLWGVDGEEL